LLFTYLKNFLGSHKSFCIQKFVVVVQFSRSFVPRSRDGSYILTQQPPFVNTFFEIFLNYFQLFFHHYFCDFSLIIIYIYCSILSEKRDGFTPSLLYFNLFIFHRVFGVFDHFLYHLTADRTGLFCCEVAIITLLKVYANFACGFHLELIHCFLCFRNNILISHLYFSFSLKAVFR